MPRNIDFNIDVRFSVSCIVLKHASIPHSLNLLLPFTVLRINLCLIAQRTETICIKVVKFFITFIGLFILHFIFKKNKLF